MASTYTPIATQTLGSAVSSVTFSSIAGTYTDLVIIASVKASTGGNLRMRFNSDSGTNYSSVWIGAVGSVTSGRTSNEAFLRTDDQGYIETTQFNIHTINIQNYSNAITYKTSLTTSGSPATGQDALFGLWRSTSSITAVELYASAGNLAVGSTFTLYGIKAA